MGKIVTFYSYKGGTGRSMALANVAWALASNGNKVLVVDWDLEAPGLHRYFRPFLADKDLIEPESKGLIEFVGNYIRLAATPPAEGTRPEKWYEPHAEIWKWAAPLRWPDKTVISFGKRGEIQFVPAGQQGPEYPERVNTFDWQALYQDHGVSDTSGICTIQMPDVLVVCYTYNLQSIEGASAIARIVQTKRPEVTIFPVAMRVELNESDLLQPMRKLARERFGSFVTGPKGAYFDQMEVPYYTKYSFSEKLAAFEEYPNAKGSINSDVTQLTRRITGGEVRQVSIEDSYRRAVAKEFGIPVSVPPAVAKSIPKASQPPAGTPWAALAWFALGPALALLLLVAWRHVPQPQPVSVSVDPPAVQLGGNQSYQFASTVQGAREPGVIWSASLGTISSSGLYLPPKVDTAQTAIITATSTVDRSRSGTAAVTITTVPFVVDPPSVTLKAGESRVFRAGYPNKNPIQWSLSPNVGTLDRTEGDRVAYVAPPIVAANQRVTLTASSTDGMAGASVELLSPNGAPSQWPYLFLVLAASTFGAYAVTWIANYRPRSPQWYWYSYLRLISGAFIGMTIYVGYISLSSFETIYISPPVLTMLAILVGFASNTLAERVTTTISAIFEDHRSDRMMPR
jgi:hypothetical protein